jgi:hypothetical protein
MSLRHNGSRLVTQILAGEVWPPLADRHAYRVDADGQPFLLPGMGGVTLGVHPGDPATGYAGDHLEPGLSVRHRDPRADAALQFLTCVGNPVTVTTGPAAGSTGVVTGQHAYVLVDLPEERLAAVAPGDQVTVRARGQGLRLLDHPDVVVKNLDPDLLDRMPIRTRQAGLLEVHVAARVPAAAVGAGAGMVSEFANTDLMGAYAGMADDLSLRLERLRIGDLVLLEDQDHRYGRGHREGWATIGAVNTGSCRLFGHGPGPSTLLSGPAEAFHVVDDADANLAAFLGATEVAA